MAGDPDHHRRLKALIESGQPCAFQARGPGGEVAVDGRASGAVAWLRLQPALPNDGGLPPAPRLAALLDALPHPVWLAHGAGLIWANQAWLSAVEATSIEDAIARKLAFDRGANALVAEAAQAGERRDAQRWTPVGGPAARVSPERSAARGRRHRRLGAGRDRRGGDPRGAAPQHRGARRDAEPPGRRGRHLQPRQAPLVPQHRLRPAVGAGAGLAGRGPDPRRAARSPAPAPAAAGDRGLRALEGRRAQLVRGAQSFARRPLDAAGRPHASRGAPAASAGRASRAVLRHDRRASPEGAVQRADPGAAGDAGQAERRGRRVRLRRSASPLQRGLRPLLEHHGRRRSTPPPTSTAWSSSACRACTISSSGAS